MFWRFGGYANISTIDSILDKPDISLEEVLEESDLIQELKQHNSKLIEYLRDDAILQRLLEYVVAPPIVAPEADDEEDEADESPTTKKTFSPVRSLSIGRGRSEKSKQQEEREAREKEEKTRQKHAYVACEILASETWSILEALLENQAALKKLWEFVRREAPLDPVTAGYFTKVNETLIDKKTEEMLAFFKSLEDIVPAMLQHVDCPMVMDLLLKIISMEKAEGGQGIVDWLQSQNLISLLLGFLGPEHPTFTQTSAGDFIKAIITISANASQNEQSCIGPNSLTRQLVSETCVERMITDMLRGGNPLTVGVGIIIEVIRKNNSDYDPEITAGQEMPPTTNDPIYLGTLLRNFARHVPDFMALLLSPNHTISDGTKTRTEPRPSLAVAFGKEPIEPLGFDRFKTCELMAELLHCSNMGLLNERGSEAYIRQRDKERERLRAEGTLPVQRSPTPREPHSAVTEFSEDESGGLAVEVTGPDAAPGEPSTPPRKLEVTNNAEDDGYEDVGASPEYADDLRDDFDERPGFEIEGEAVPAASPITPSKSRVSLDDEFFDEPLTSPSLLSRTAEPARSPPAENEDDDRPAPLSPTKVANQLHETHLEEKEPEHQEADGEPSSTDALVAEIDSHLSSPATGDEASSPPERKLHLQVRPEGNDPSSPRGLSPHAEDQPAPLFASPEPQSQPETNEPAPEPTIMMLEPTEKPQPNALQNDVLEESHEPQVDPAYAVDQGQDFTAHMETDIDGEPIVGDYLKMVFVEHRVVPTILDFFFRFPWNNFLHNVVYDVVQQVFNGPMDRGYNRALAIDLFAAGDVTGRIVAGQARSDAAAARTHTRLGYMGHLTLVAEEVVKFAERHPPEVLGEAVVAKVTSDVWAAYVEHTLAATRERDNAILGGVRLDAGGAGAGGALGGGAGGGGIAQISPAFVGAGSSALANAGLNGGGGGREEAGAVGQRLFGAGDSDEEDEEEVEANEEREEGAEEHEQYSYTPSSLGALSIFSPPGPPNDDSSNSPQAETADASSPSTADPNTPDSSSTSTDSSQKPAPHIPPPQSIAPSRARRQLAARLALHSKKPSSDSTATSPASSSGDASPASAGLSPSSDPGSSAPHASPFGAAHVAANTQQSPISGNPAPVTNNLTGLAAVLARGESRAAAAAAAVQARKHERSLSDEARKKKEKGEAGGRPALAGETSHSSPDAGNKVDEDPWAALDRADGAKEEGRVPRTGSADEEWSDFETPSTDAEMGFEPEEDRHARDRFGEAQEEHVEVR